MFLMAGQISDRMTTADQRVSLFNNCMPEKKVCKKEKQLSLVVHVSNGFSNMQYTHKREPTCLVLKKL